MAARNGNWHGQLINKVFDRSHNKVFDRSLVKIKYRSAILTAHDEKSLLHDSTRQNRSVTRQNPGTPHASCPIWCTSTVV